MHSNWHISAVSVNHNTSAYMELMLRSMASCHPSGLAMDLTVYDNASCDEMSELRRYAARQDIPILPSGFPLNTQNNSHGDVLRSFVLSHPDCSHYLFLDADVRFIEPNTIPLMLEELERSPGLFGIGPRMSWDGIHEIPVEVRRSNPDICDARLHPCCALVRNTPIFRQVVDLVGLACVRALWAEHDEYLDTFKLMTRVMQTHGLKHGLAAVMVQHFFCVSYDWDTEEIKRSKAETRDRFLSQLRALEKE